MLDSSLSNARCSHYRFPILVQMSLLLQQIVSLRGSSLSGAGELAAALRSVWQA